MTLLELLGAVAVEVVLEALAAYRLYRLLAVDDLPPVATARDWIVRKVDKAHGDEWAHGLECPWCLGFWCSLLVVGLLDLAVSVPLPALQVAAVSTLVGLLAKAGE